MVWVYRDGVYWWVATAIQSISQAQTKNPSQLCQNSLMILLVKIEFYSNISSVNLWKILQEKLQIFIGGLTILFSTLWRHLAQPLASRSCYCSHSHHHHPDKNMASSFLNVPADKGQCVRISDTSCSVELIPTHLHLLCCQKCAMII